MKIEDCKNSTEWDYLGYKKYPEIGYEYAKDWSITLMTKINMIRSMVLNNSRQYKPNRIKLHPNLKPLIDLIVDIYGTMFLDQYIIVFDYGIDEDIIFVYYDGSIDAIPLIKGGMLELRIIGQCSEEQIIEYKKSICGYIKILNYTNMEKEQTLGQKRVKADFNPAKNDLVDQIKNKSAELIDLCEQLRTEGSTGEKQRLVSIAQTEIETACMYAVKANFTE